MNFKGPFDLDALNQEIEYMKQHPEYKPWESPSLPTYPSVDMHIHLHTTDYSTQHPTDFRSDFTHLTQDEGNKHTEPNTLSFNSADAYYNAALNYHSHLHADAQNDAYGHYLQQQQAEQARHQHEQQEAQRQEQERQAAQYRAEQQQHEETQARERAHEEQQREQARQEYVHQQQQQERIREQQAYEQRLEQQHQHEAQQRQEHRQ